MKKITLILTLLFFGVISAQENYELTTLRIGPYKIFMKADEAEKIADKKLLQFDEWEKSNTVNYQGENIEIKILNIFISEKENNVPAVYSLSTTSPKFKTKFSVNQGWEDNGEKTSKTISYFNLSDLDATTELSFKLENNIVTQVSIFINEGC